MKMHINRKIAVAVSTVSIVIVAAAPTFHRTRPGVRCDIPVRDYQYNKLSQPLRSLSEVPVLIDVPLNARTNGGSTVPSPTGLANRQPQRVKSFQFVKVPTLQIDHCTISDMSVLVHENGNWTISLRANQNPLNARKPLDVTTLEPKQLFTDHLKRNQFHVVAYCYAQYGPGDGKELIGKPLVIPLVIKPYWVQKQQPCTIFEPGYHPDIQRHFDSLDRVEIEFAYQLD